MRIVVAMSGGVDSSVAAARLRAAGHDVTGVFLSNGIAAGPAAARARQGCCGAADAADAARVADVLGIPFYALDLAAEFDRLVGDFAAAYAAGRTPNPCVACNRDLKLGRLLAFAQALGAAAVATGHYARLERHRGRFALRAAADARKDQSYVLFPLSQTQLERTLFPLGGSTKAETRAEARRLGLPVAEKPESMELCFVPGGDYRDVLRERAPGALRPGAVVDQATGAVVGRHAGVGTVTLGQRRGLGIAASAPRYVTGIDAERSEVRVGGADDLLRREVVVEGWNAVAEPPPAQGSRLRGRAKVRRNHDAQRVEAEVLPGAGPVLRFIFEEPVRAPAPGQALVLYDDADRVVGGGFIARSSK